jgi:membrane protein required for colicin V production
MVKLLEFNGGLEISHATIFFLMLYWLGFGIFSYLEFMGIDIVFLILMVLAIFKGYRRGLIVALFSVLAFIIGLAAAIKLSAVTAVYIQHNINIASRWLPILSFALVFIIVIVLVRFGAGLLEKTLKLAMLSWANRLGGIILYAALYTIMLSIVLFYVNKMGLFKQETIHDSATYHFVADLGPWAINGFGKVAPVFKGMFGQLETFFENIARKAA